VVVDSIVVVDVDVDPEKRSLYLYHKRSVVDKEEGVKDKG
jgi:hypothetical protein